jgi:hypothetical protein
MTEAPDKETVHQDDEHEENEGKDEDDDEEDEAETEVEGDKLPSQTQPSKQNYEMQLPLQWIDTTSDPAHLRSMTEALDKETEHQDDVHEENEEEDDDEEDEAEAEVKGDKLTSQTCIKQKKSSRRKKTPLTRTDDFLWG